MDLPLTGTDVYAMPREQGEWVLRRQLAAAYRMVDHFGWTELIYGHLTARVPGPEPHFLINPYGLNYDEVTASNLVKIDCDGNIVEPTNYPVNYAGFVIHSAVHMANSSTHKCVMHTHTRAGMAVSALEDGLLPISMVSTGFTGQISYHEYEGPSLDTGERGRLLEHLGDSRAMILRNHGLLVTGRSVPEAFLRLYRLERACQIQIDAAAAGRLHVLDHQVAVASGKGIDSFSEMESQNGVGDLEFAALLRKLDKTDPTWRH